MNINNQATGEKMIIGLEGRLDTTTSPQLEEELKGALEGIKELEFDFSKLEYISSAGLRILLSAQKMINKQDGRMKVTHVSEEIMEIFEVTACVDILTIE